MGAAASATFSGTFVKTAILARARDHLQRTRPPHELRVTTQPQAGTRPKFEALGGAQKHQDALGHPGYPRAHTTPHLPKYPNRHVRERALRPRWRGPLRQFQTATGVPLTAQTASCDMPELPSTQP
eukprot:COSAG01_NODE_10_length_42970_cov_93.010007_57_plen_126_part_00